MQPVTYERQVYYYETDRMDCVHHSNYIRWFEEARVNLMRELSFSYEGLEAAGIVSPVLRIDAEYRTMARFGETVCIAARVESYTGVRISFSYIVTDKGTGEVRCRGNSQHCFINEKGRPVMLPKVMPEYHRKIKALLERG